MKLFLLCTGLTLFITLSALAQDTIPHSIPDSAKPVTATQVVADSAANDTTGVTGSKADSLQIKSAKDSIPRGAAVEKTPARGGEAEPGKDTAADVKNSDTGKIVDIFEEMDKARQRQDKSIENEQATQKTDDNKGQPPAGTAQSNPSIAAADSAGNLAATDKPTGPGSNNQDRAPQDSTQGSAPGEMIKKDTIQSIFTLPATAASGAGLSTGELAGAASGINDTAGDSRVAPLTDAQQNSNKTAVKERLDKLFEATADSAAKDTQAITQKTDPPVTNVPADSAYKDNSDTGKVSQTGVPVPVTRADTSTSTIPDNTAPQTGSTESTTADGRLRAPADSSELGLTGTDSTLQPKNTPFTELFQPYSAFNKETQISSTTSLTILQQNVDYKTSADFTTQYQRTGQKEGNFIFDVSVTKLNTEVQTMGVQLKYDSNQKSDSTSTFAKPLFDIVGKKTYLQVDSTGKITAVDNTELGRQINSVLSGLSLSGGDFEVGSNFGLLMSKSGPQVGDEWSDTVNNGGNNRITTYKVQSIMDGDMMVTISGTVNQTGVINSDGAVFKTHFTGIQKGKMYVDQQTLLVKSRDLTLNMKGTVDYNGQALPASAVSKIKEKVTGS